MSIDADSKSVHHRSTQDDNADVREKLRELANQRRRFGYRRLHILQRRLGIAFNRKTTQRLYKEGGLACRGQLPFLIAQRGKPGMATG